MINSCRFYKNNFPTVSDTVMTKVETKNEFGYTVSLLEYNCIPGFIAMSELVRRKMKKKNIIKIGEIVPLCVIYVDQTKNHINLSKTKLLPDDAQKFTDSYKFRCNLNKLGMEIYNIYNKHNNNNLLTPEHIMENTIWRTIDNFTQEIIDYEKIYNNTLRKLDDLLNVDIFQPEFLEKLKNILHSRILKKNMISETEIKLVVMSKEGVYGVKDILDIDMNTINPDFKVDIITYSSPKYKIMLYGPRDELSEEIVDKILDIIKQRTVKYKSKFTVTIKNNIIKESDVDIRFLSTYEMENLVI